MNQSYQPSTIVASPWPHRVARLLLCVTFPLIWVGGLVTTYDAGMAVPDWPTTYNYSMFSYPWQKWLYGPWDLFVEHGHRQLGAIVGMIAIALVIATWARDARWWVRIFAVVCLLAVIGQGVLGGVRVLREDPRLAMVHGCTGPLFFCMTLAMAAVTSRWWREADQSVKSAAGTATRSLVPLAWIVFALTAGQLVLGAQLRHAQVGSPPGVFRTMVVFHLIGALLVVLHVVMLAVRTLRSEDASPLLRRPAMALLMQVTLQIGLGLGTWVVKYNFPVWAQTAGLTTDFTVNTGSFWQASIITGHVAIGSLLLATSLLLALRATRFENARRVTVALPSVASTSMLWSLL